MLKTLSHEFNEHKLIIIEDTAKCNADELFTAVLSSALKIEPQSAFLVCTEKSSLTYSSKLSSSIQSFDVLSMFVENNPQQCNLFEKLSLLQIVKDLKQKHIFIDSINPIIWDCGILQFVKDLIKLIELDFHFIVRIHSDSLFEEDHLNCLLYYCTAYFKVLENFGFNKFLIETILKKTDKKLFGKKVLERVSVEDDYSLQIIADDLKLEKPQHTSVSINTLTTFNLGTNMSLTEKEARDRLILPYLRTSENDGSLITYEADEADLEEDPDEDLEL